MRLGLIFALLALALEGSSGVDYCHIESCPAGSHTLCKYPSSTPGEKCLKGGNLGGGLSDVDRLALLNKHNELRGRVARGGEGSGNPGLQPPATNMATMTWDEELSKIAQRWADQCEFDHDKCRRVEHSSVGQNIGLIGTNGNVDKIDTVDIVRSWYNEVQYFSRYDVAEFKGVKAADDKVIGHYTQLVWAKSSKLGCGSRKYHNGSDWLYLVCNYEPGGNVKGQPVYETPFPLN